MIDREPHDPRGTDRREHERLDRRADQRIDRCDLAQQAVATERAREHEADPRHTLGKPGELRDTERCDADRDPLHSAHAFAQQRDAEHDADQRIEEVTEARVHHSVGHDRIDEREEVDRQQHRRSREHPQRGRLGQRVTQLAHAPADRDEHDVHERGPTHAVGDELDRADAVELLPEEREQSPRSVGEHRVAEPDRRAIGFG